MNNSIIELNGVLKSYGKVLALNGVNLSLSGGRIVGLLGPNGSGKTTTLKVLMRIIRPQAGNVFICGMPVGYETRKYISFMPDREYLYKNMTIKSAMAYYADMFSDFDYNKANNLCNILGIANNMETNLSKLSKGNREKVVLMLTLSRNVPIYLLDEPLGSLDPVIKHEMLGVIKQSSNPNNLILISTHLIKDTESILDEVVFLKNGTVAYQGMMSSIVNDEKKTLESKYLEVFTNV